MPDQRIHTHILPNGLTLVLEPMRDVQSAAFTLLVPAGSVYDPPDKSGNAAAVCDWITRGAGDLDSHQLSDALDQLGLQRHESIERQHIAFHAASLGENIPAALELYAKIVQSPHFDAEDFEPVVRRAEQTIQSIEEEPRSRVMQELRLRSYPAPWGWPPEGTLAGLRNLVPEDGVSFCKKHVRPNGSILGIAGEIDPNRIIDQIEHSFGSWKERAAPPILEFGRGPTRVHLTQESAQTQIGIAYDSVPYDHTDYIAAWAAVSVLSGGSSSRLFTEVREKRGLCYSIYATLHSMKTMGQVLCYAGTTVERAQETLDVTIEEIQRLQHGILEEELERCRVRAKSSLIMQQESTTSRAQSIAQDWYLLGKVQTLEEIRSKIESLAVPQIMEHLQKFPQNNLTILTLGPQPLEQTNGVS